MSKAHTPTDVALGNFDGVHLGHQTVIRPILPPQTTWRSVEDSLTTEPVASLQGYSDRSSSLLAASDLQASQVAPLPPNKAPIPTVVTFYPHPREFFLDEVRPWLTPLEEKAAFMRQLGVGQLVLLPFNQELANLSPETFIERVLLERLQAKHISVGADFRFGHGRTGTVELLEKLATRQGVTVTVVDLAENEGDRISSSRIRQALCTGDVPQAQQLLGRPYRLTGRVVQGQQLGRQLGFPTANLNVSADKYLPRTGVYSVRVYGVPGTIAHQGLPGVMNLGVRPTVDGKRQTIEVHLLNWDGNLYGSTLTVELKGFLRPEQRFESLENLKAQIQADCAAAQTALEVGNYSGSTA